MLPRGIRGCNPGNIEHNPKNKWQGLAPAVDKRFCSFLSPVWGIRAMAVLLVAYYDRYECTTVRQLISRWAKTDENPTERYIQHVSRVTGVSPDQTLYVPNYDVMSGLVRGIVTFENGNGEAHGNPKEWYAPEVYDEALRRAGIVRKKPAAEPVQLGAVAAVGTAAAFDAGQQLLGAPSERAQHMGSLVLVAAVILSMVAYRHHKRIRRAERQ